MDFLKCHLGGLGASGGISFGWRPSMPLTQLYRFSRGAQDGFERT
jgi:hypothetical protein